MTWKKEKERVKGDLVVVVMSVTRSKGEVSEGAMEESRAGRA